MSDLVKRLQEHDDERLYEEADFLLCEAANEIVRLRAEVERLNQCLQYEQHRAGRIGTHCVGCWEWGPQHYECAVAEVERLRRFADKVFSVMSSASSDLAEIDEAMAELEAAAPAPSQSADADDAARGGES